jgi:hypothetical protein
MVRTEYGGVWEECRTYRIYCRGFGLGFNLCVAPLCTLLVHISEEWRCHSRDRKCNGFNLVRTGLNGSNLVDFRLRLQML